MTCSENYTLTESLKLELYGHNNYIENYIFTANWKDGPNDHMNCIGNYTFSEILK